MACGEHEEIKLFWVLAPTHFLSVIFSAFLVFISTVQQRNNIR
ncbi:hypothetical protein HanHA300_Chr04g0148721 [Helianthus annuus]|nr:hypothetical protein HanHA300_Chr04g0148721 [Helianthus annuus]KAJ0598103.1 hypothetical protein HanHA89_Chr04g0162111 [Helianthus annuus]KAJ0762393.1 hypothetical protein HanOQP8_Chr04g0160861 [Helianthus annuus]